jgi:hypothetical protein
MASHQNVLLVCLVGLIKNLIKIDKIIILLLVIILFYYFLPMQRLIRFQRFIRPIRLATFLPRQVPRRYKSVLAGGSLLFGTSDMKYDSLDKLANKVETDFEKYVSYKKIHDSKVTVNIKAGTAGCTITMVVKPFHPDSEFSKGLNDLETKITDVLKEVGVFEEFDREGKKLLNDPKFLEELKNAIDEIEVTARMEELDGKYVPVFDVKAKLKAEA